MTREYRIDQLVVQCDAERCIHAGERVRGASARKPFCDNSHLRSGFQAD